MNEGCTKFQNDRLISSGMTQSLGCPDRFLQLELCVCAMRAINSVMRFPINFYFTHYICAKAYCHPA